MQKTTAEQLIIKRPPGSALFTLAEIPGAHGPEIIFLVREESARIAAHVGPLIEIRSAVLLEEGVALVPVLLRVGEEKAENIFETWLNFCSPDLGLRAFKALAKQPRVLVAMYGDSLRQERSIECVNSWGGFFETAAKQILRLGSTWSMGEFDAAREKIYTAYPTVWDIWCAMQAESGGA